MADSLIAIVWLPQLTYDQQQDLQLPGRVASSKDLSTGKVTPRHHESVTVESPLTGTGFKVKGVITRVRDGIADESLYRYITGYEVSINVPTATVGNNALLRNGVPKACELAFLMVQHWLLDSGVPPHVVTRMDMEQMELLSVTPTYLYPFQSREQVLQRLFALRQATEISNTPKVKGGQREAGPNSAFGVGPIGSASAYSFDRDFDVLAYGKDQFAESAAEFHDDEIRLLVYAVSERYLRLEVKLKGAILRRLGLNRPDAWRLYGSDAVYRMVHDLVRRKLRLDQNLRGTDPTDEEITAAKLVADDLTILRWHLAGGIAQLHPLVLAKDAALKRQKYASDVKRRLLKRLRIDLAVPWATQKAAVMSGVAEWLHYPGMFEPPNKLKDAVFGEESANARVFMLRRLLSQQLPRTPSNLVLDDEPGPLVDIGTLAIEQDVRHELLMAGVPLHRLLACHEAGYFGSISAEDQATMAQRARDGQSVTSYFGYGEWVVALHTSPGSEGAPSSTEVTLRERRSDPV